MKRFSVFFITLSLILSTLLSACSEPIALTNESLAETREEITSNEEEIASGEEEIDPAADDILNILMVGNSGCYYYCDELYEMLTAAGIKARVCNLYYSGCRVSQHWEWFVPPQANYDYYEHDDKGRQGVKNTTLQYALDQRPWDIITLQQAIGPKMAQSFEYAMKQTQNDSRSLYNIFRMQHPKAEYYWHEFWAFEVGYNKPDGLGVVDSVETQSANAVIIRQVGEAIAKENNAPLIPTGSAWQIARANGSGDLTKDLLHDGETQGGQMLNASVWFEVITQKSCLDNTFKPNYKLSDDRLALLKNAAHQAVAELYGENFAK